MPLSHAVVWIDQHDAKILQFDAEQLRVENVHADDHLTRHDGGAVRVEHVFYAKVCDELVGIAKMLVTGSLAALGHFRHYVVSHRPLVATNIIGWETMNRPTEGQLLAHGRRSLADDRQPGAARDE